MNRSVANKKKTSIELVMAARVKQFRLEKDMTQAELAQAAGVVVETIARLERNLRVAESANNNPSLKTMDGIARALGRECWELLC